MPPTLARPPCHAAMPAAAPLMPPMFFSPLRYCLAAEYGTYALPLLPFDAKMLPLLRYGADGLPVSRRCRYYAAAIYAPLRHFTPR